MIEVKRLQIDLGGERLVDIAFRIRGALAMVGMSGSGKSLTLKALINMLPKSMNRVMEMECDFDPVRGEGIAVIPQNPFTSLNPMAKIGKQFYVSEDEAAALMERVGLEKVHLDRFPAELSGGQLQRAVIAMALSHNPKLLMLDEPTTALDSESKKNILSLLSDLKKTEGFYMLFVSHDIASVEAVCDEVVILKDGRVVESGLLADVVADPKDAYTRELIASNFKQREWRS